MTDNEELLEQWKDAVEFDVKRWNELHKPDPLSDVVLGTPLVSAICPTWNRRQFLPDMISSFQSQTYANKELVIVDDSAESNADLIPDDGRIRYIHLSAEHRTTGEKRNICCQHSHGEVIMHFDDDDLSHPERMTEQVKYLQQTGKPVVGYHTLIFWATDIDEMYEWTGFRPFAMGTSQTYLRTWWEQHPFEHKRIGEDADFTHTALIHNSLGSVAGGDRIIARAHASNTCTRDIRPNLGIRLLAADRPSWHEHIKETIHV